MSKAKFTIGFEIEGVFNRDYFKPQEENIGDYNNPIRWNKYFLLKEDGSLRRGFKFSNEELVEVITPVIISRKTFVNTLKDFKELFNHHNQELNKLCYFNNSCGCHFHLGYVERNGKVKHYSVLLDDERVLAFRKKFFKELEKLDISDKAKKQIKQNYFRGYAQRTTKSNYFDGRRRKEFNLTSERIGKGLEWRSFNLTGIETFEDFEKIMLLIYDLLKVNFYDRLKRGYTTKKRTIRLNKFDESNINQLNRVSEIQPLTIRR